MLRLKQLDQDDSRILSVGEHDVLIPFIPAGVELLLHGELTTERVNKVFHMLFFGRLPNEAYRQITPLERVKLIRSLRERTSGEPEIEDYETVIELNGMISFLTVKMNLPKNELLSRFSLVELIQITGNLKGDNDFPFYTHQKIARSIEDVKAFLG